MTDEQGKVLRFADTIREEARRLDRMADDSGDAPGIRARLQGKADGLRQAADNIVEEFFPYHFDRDDHVVRCEDLERIVKEMEKKAENLEASIKGTRSPKKKSALPTVNEIRLVSGGEVLGLRKVTDSIRRNLLKDDDEGRDDDEGSDDLD